jgi:hypothetical protein
MTDTHQKQLGNTFWKIAAFTSRGKWKARLQPLLDMLVLLGRARESSGKYY